MKALVIILTFLFTTSWSIAVPQESSPVSPTPATDLEKVQCQAIVKSFTQYINMLNETEVKDKAIDSFVFTTKPLACSGGTSVLLLARLLASKFLINDNGVKEEICVYKKDLLFVNLKEGVISAKIATSFPVVGPAPCKEVRKQTDQDYIKE